MKIAVIGSFDFHTECIGFIIHMLEGLPDLEIDTYVYSDKENYIDYFMRIYPNVKITINQFYEFFANESKYNLTIKLTSNDPILSSDKCLSIAHTKAFNEQGCNYLTLTPSISGENITYTFPIYRGITNLCFKKTICIIGFFVEQHFDEDTKNFISQLNDYVFIVMGRTHPGNEIRKFPNVVIKSHPNTYEMINLILNSKFILTRKLPHQSTTVFSGALSLAVCHKKPMIINKTFADLYNLPGITFDKDYCETINTIRFMPDINYHNHVEKLDRFAETEGNLNKMKIKQFLKQ